MLRWRLTEQRRQVLGEKFLDLANYAATAMVFGQFVGEPRVSWRVMTAGVVIWALFAAISLALQEED
jgi:hypothetical protein